MMKKRGLPSERVRFQMRLLTEKGRHTRRTAGRRGGFVVARRGLLLDGAGGLAVHAADLAFEDRRLARVLEGTRRGVVELYPVLK